MHIESALAGVPKDQRCKCREEGKQPEMPSLWQQIFG